MEGNESMHDGCQGPDVFDSRMMLLNCGAFNERYEVTSRRIVCFKKYKANKGNQRFTENQ